MTLVVALYHGIDSMLFTWLPDMYAVAYPNTSKKTGQPWQPWPFVGYESLTHTWPVRAFFLPYVLRYPDGSMPAQGLRVQHSYESDLAPFNLRVCFTHLVFDIDAPNKDANEAWLSGEYTKVLSLPEPLRQALGIYSTKGGYRLLWRLSRELSPAEYMAVYALTSRVVGLCGIGVDPQCKDWQRCYKYPLVTVDGRVTTSDIFIDNLAAGKTLQVPDAVEPVRERFKLPESIPAMRNGTLASLAGVLRRQGFGETELLATLQTANERCETPLDANEVADIARKITRYPSAMETAQGEPPKQAELTRGTGMELADSYLQALATSVVFDRGALFAYSAQLGIWQAKTESFVAEYLQPLDGRYFVSGMSTKGEPKYSQLRIENGTVEGVYKLACKLRNAKGFFDNAPACLVSAQGAISATAGYIQVTAPNEGNRATALWAHNYAPNATSAIWEWFLADCLEDSATVELVKELIGVALLGKATSMQKHLFLTGRGENGKSTFLKGLEKIFAGLRVVSITPHAYGSQYDMADLANARANIVTEVGGQSIRVTSTLKAALSGDTIRARPIYDKPFDFQPRCAAFFSAQDLPPIEDSSHGFWRRWVVVGFNRKVANPIGDLDERLIADAGAFASVCLDAGARALARGRYEVPAHCVDTLARWRSDTDAVALFAESRLTAGQGVSYESAYRAFAIFAGMKGERAVREREFVRRLDNLGIDLTTKSLKTETFN